MFINWKRHGESRAFAAWIPAAPAQSGQSPHHASMSRASPGHQPPQNHAWAEGSASEDTLEIGYDEF